MRPKWHSMRVDVDVWDYLKSMQSDAEAEDDQRYSLNNMVQRLIEDQEELMK